MTAFLDVGAVQIQAYLARTPSLRLRRGASWMLVRATRPQEIRRWISQTGLAGVEVNPEAGHADGVVSLMVPEGSEQATATRLMLYLRSRVPAVQWRAWWASADSYLAAAAAARSPDVAGLIALPQVADFTLAETCEFCRIDLRINSTSCADCRERDDAAGRRVPAEAAGHGGEADDEPDALGTERDVLDEVSAAVGRRLGIVDDLGRLAAMGEQDGNRNHVATVALDGNAMGAFFTSLTGHADPRIKSQISPRVSQATRAALAAATSSIVHGEDRHLPVVPHVAGGDDVVASVVADRAWAFATAFMRRFAAELAAAADQLQLPTQVQAALPSMSAGMVFAHHKFPYARAVHLAEQALRRAKQDTRGAEAAVCWLDVTVDGEQLPPWRRTFTLRQLEGELDNELRSLHHVGKSGRQELTRILAAGTEEQATAAALVWARRNAEPAVANLLEQLQVTGARNAVAMCRWWRP